MFEQDRPIKPQKQYLQQCQNKRKQEQKNKKHHYLQKAYTGLLPCYKQNANQKFKRRSRSNSPKQKLSKAQQYQLIKKVNRQKFGQWNKHGQIPKQNEIKKINPNKMTVDYKPKKVNIDTRQYKKPNYVPTQNDKNKINEEKQKLEYTKMIEYMKKLYIQFEKQKQMFEKQKQYLRFKKKIENQEGIVIETTKQIINKQQTQKKLQLNKSIKSIKNVKKQSSKQQNKKQGNSKKIVIDDIEEQPKPNPELQKFNYTVENLHECNPFTIRQLHKYFHFASLLPQNSALNIQAKKIVEQNRQNSKTKIIKPNCTHGSIGTNHVVCCQQQCAEKRITKFQKGWYQVWVAGKYRTIYNKQIGYKSVWYGNGDIKQQFSQGKVHVYFSESKKVVEVKVGQHLPFWYFPKINQIQTKDNKGNTQIIFADGRHQIIALN